MQVGEEGLAEIDVCARRPCMRRFREADRDQRYDTQGKEDPEVALLKVTVEAAEYWDAPNSTMVHAYGYVKAVLTGESPKPGENRKVSFA